MRHLCLWLLLWAPLWAGDFTVDVGRGDVLVHVPPTQDQPAPLLLLLHGYTSSGSEVEGVLELAPLAAERGFVYAYPNGTQDFLGNRFWDATDACCNFTSPPVDDVGYLLALIDAIGAEITLDPYQIFIAGHSNGGFMAHRLACERPDLFAAIISVAGATFLDSADCNPSEPIHVLQIHGTDDETISYTGGNLGFTPYPGAFDTVQSWVLLNQCSTFETPGEPLDLIDRLSGAETQVSQWVTECATNGSAHLWTIQGGTHVPEVNTSFGPLVFDFLSDHAKPVCVGDLNRDQRVDAADVDLHLLAWRLSPEPMLDGNRDGRVDVLDLIGTLNAQGSCHNDPI